MATEGRKTCLEGKTVKSCPAERVRPACIIKSEWKMILMTLIIEVIVHTCTCNPSYFVESLELICYDGECGGYLKQKHEERLMVKL